MVASCCTKVSNNVIHYSQLGTLLKQALLEGKCAIYFTVYQLETFSLNRLYERIVTCFPELRHKSPLFHIMSKSRFKEKTHLQNNI